MTIGILWEFYEFTADSVLRTDMQKDKIIQNISSVELNLDRENIPIKVNDIEKQKAAIATYSGDDIIYI